jgi:cell division protease FtsH
MKDFVKKLLKKIKESKRYKEWEKLFQEQSADLSTKELALLGILSIIILDMSIYLVSSIKGHEESNLTKISKDISEFSSFDMNHSALDEMLKFDKVYFVVDEELNVNVILKEGNLTKEIKDIPIYSITRNLEKKLIEKEINYQWIKAEKPNPPFIILSFITEHILDILIIGLIIFMLQSTGMMLNGDKFTVYKPKEIKGSMDDIIGYEDIKEEIQHLVDMLKNMHLYSKYGIEDFFNIMFSGVQGTGKTTMAVQIAKKLDVPILVATGNIETGIVGGGAKVIRSIYAKAKEIAINNENRTCIVFIDEAQNLLMKRGQSKDKWVDDSPNELLTHLEGVKTIHNVKIITIVASNFDESNMQLDEAMGARFKKKIHFRLPNEDEREELLTYFLKRVEKKDKNLNVEKLAKTFSGISPRTIQTIVQEASLLAIVEKSNVGEEHLMKAFEVVMIGKSNRKTTKDKERERHIISVHEIGHFLANFKLTMAENNFDIKATEKKIKVIKISSENISRINALGYVLNESEDILLHSINELEKEIQVLYAGVATEELIFGKEHITTGASNDIEKVTRILHHLFIETSSYSNAKLKLDKIETLKDIAYKEMEDKSIELYQKTIELLKEEQALIEHLAKILIERWVLSKEEIFEEISLYKESKNL